MTDADVVRAALKPISMADECVLALAALDRLEGQLDYAIKELADLISEDTGDLSGTAYHWHAMHISNREEAAEDCIICRIRLVVDDHRVSRGAV